MPKRPPADTLFWRKVVKPPMLDCWLWTGARHKGYGLFYTGGRRVYAHRFAWQRANGAIPAGKMLLHWCDVRCCVNPAHLSLGTVQDNVADMVAKRRHVFGERRGNAVLTEWDVRDIRASPQSTTALAKHYGVTPSAISQIRTGKNWRHVSETIDERSALIVALGTPR